MYLIENTLLKQKSMKRMALFYIFVNAFFMFIYLFWERAWAGEGQRERENPKEAQCCQHRAGRGVRTHELGYHDLSWNQESDA